MTNQDSITLLKKIRTRIVWIKVSFTALLLILVFLVVESYLPYEPGTPHTTLKNKENTFEIQNGIHIPTGLNAGSGFETTKSVCLACHSAKLITQNRATAEGWKEMIVWMQETQGLPDLGDKEEEIINYLATYYAPIKSGRRPLLDTSEIEWYTLNMEE
jgi:hypothetical protein